MALIASELEMVAFVCGEKMFPTFKNKVSDLMQKPFKDFSSNIKVQILAALT